jgi:hypothetical protein
LNEGVRAADVALRGVVSSGTLVVSYLLLLLHHDMSNYEKRKETYNRPHHKVPSEILRILVYGGRVEGLDVIASH